MHEPEAPSPIHKENDETVLPRCCLQGCSGLWPDTGWGMPAVACAI